MIDKKGKIIELHYQFKFYKFIGKYTEKCKIFQYINQIQILN